RPIALAPARDQSSRGGASRFLVIFNEGHTVLTSVPDTGQQYVVLRSPRLHGHACVIEYEQRRKAGDKFAHDDALLDKTVVTPMVLARKRPMLKCAMFPLESSRER